MICETMEHAVQKVTTAAENSSQELRNIESLKIGQGIRQGDVYLIRIEDAEVGVPMRTKQLAIGVTMGSQHIVPGYVMLYENVSRPKYVRDEAILGPVVKSDKRFVLTHPEHAHFSLPAGTYQCVFQLDARTKKAVVD